MSAAQSRKIIMFGPLVVVMGALATPAAGASFKARYYPDCYAPVSAARDMVEPPPVDVAGGAKKASEVAGALGKLGGVPGFGAFGGLAKAASTASQVATYSNYLADAAEFTKKMQEDYPDPAARLEAYGERMGEDADKVGEAAVKLDEAQACYETAFLALKANLAAGEVKSRDAVRYQKEIQEGLEIVSEVLNDSEKTLDTNMKSYNEALTSDSSGMGLNLGSIAQAASTGVSAANALGVGGGGATSGRPNAGMYAAYQAQSNAYTSAWWDEYNRSGDSNAAAAAARTTLAGDGSQLRAYQQVYWNSQAVAGTQAALSGVAPVSPVANLGALSALSQIGGMSGTGMAWMAANAAAGAASSAAGGGGEAIAAAPAQAQAVAANATQAAGLLNAARGLSGSGGALVGGNIAAGLLSSAINSGGQEAEPAEAAPIELSEAMQESLLNTSVHTSRFTDAYGLVTFQKQRQAGLQEVVSAKLD